MMFRFKTKPVAIATSLCLALAVLGYAYYQVPGLFHSFLYDHDTFRDCDDCPEMVVI